MSRVHAQARTIPRTRAEIQASAGSQRALAQRFNVTRSTVQKWQSRDQVEDLSHRPHRLATTLTEGQEAVVVELRKTLLLPLDDLLVVTREFINKLASRSGIDRCLRRHGVANLGQLLSDERTGSAPVVKTFKSYEPGFVHVDIKYLPQMPDETSRRYLFVAIDRATRWVHLAIYNDQTEASSVDFVRSLVKAAPMKIVKILTDNGSQFTDRFTSRTKVPTGQHPFDRECTAFAIEHRLSPPRHPQTNGLVERFNGRIAEVIKQTRFKSRDELETTIELYTATYNHRIPQRALNHLSPVQALQKWQTERPELFVKRGCNQTGLDT